MIPFLTEVLELLVAGLLLAGSLPFLKNLLANTKCSQVQVTSQPFDFYGDCRRLRNVHRFTNERVCS
ncbi:hypothetical protein SAMN06295998_10472 [Primorskyibacter flagellatus]|uniref:Uncharacterized protein n=1 Tax=Primorskyibacter flagellatus TaxID=1387277 RepID=A0A1W2BJP6_9RHOB|nr:hypothetical protein SAMN06295998_10472 [Primorskyibacter flagellatus]